MTFFSRFPPSPGCCSVLFCVSRWTMYAWSQTTKRAAPKASLTSSSKTQSRCRWQWVWRVRNFWACPSLCNHRRRRRTACPWPQPSSPATDPSTWGPWGYMWDRFTSTSQRICWEESLSLLERWVLAVRTVLPAGMFGLFRIFCCFPVCVFFLLFMRAVCLQTTSENTRDQKKSCHYCKNCAYLCFVWKIIFLWYYGCFDLLVHLLELLVHFTWQAVLK